MSPTKLPTPKKPQFRLPRLRLGNPLTTATAISFSLTFVAGGIALLLGLFPAHAIIGSREVDTGVILLLVPLTALLFAIIVEVVRSILREGLRPAKPRQANPLSAWKPGHGEG